ncbi:PQQ-binding-like beta-propeller repeat protein [Streptomyces sp. NPDC127119]|uniref:outer membrane protein assembly factor BamB family protein n=1 Tax=Streptomyces sp. NPDC127119 TaxID=3345370 RepID=UPI00363E60AD
MIHEGRPIRKVIVLNDYAVGMDGRGDLVQWSLDTLDMTSYLDLRALGAGLGRPARADAIGLTTSPGTPWMSPWGGRVYTGDTVGNLLALDGASLSLEEVLPPTGEGPVTSLCSDHPSVHALAHGTNEVFLGSLATMEFSRVPALEHGRVRSIHHDARHDRFWVVANDETAPFGQRDAVVLLTMDGSVEYTMPFFRYGVEFLEFSPDGATVYVGSAEGELQVIGNSRNRLRLRETVTGFPHQLTDATVGADGSVFVLTLSGELVRIDPDLDCVQSRAPVLRQSAYDLSLAPGEEDRLYCATDDGVALLRLLPSDPGRSRVTGANGGAPRLSETEHHATRFGATRRVVGVPSGYVGIGQKGVVFRSDCTGKLLWHVDLDDFGFYLAASTDHQRLLVATGIGGVELDSDTGTEIARLSLDGVPLTACSYGPTGERILANQNGTVCAFAADSADELWWIETSEHIHRISSQADTVYVCGTGGLLAFHPGEGRLTGSWECAPCVPIAATVTISRVHLVCDNGELHTYDLDGRPVGVVGQLMDLPHVLASLPSTGDAAYLVAGGSGGYLSTFAESQVGPPVRLRDTYLARRSGQSFQLHLN